MLKPPIPADEQQRIAALDRVELLYTPPEEIFDKVTARLATIFDVPIATMSLIDRDLQYYKSAIGLPPEVDAARVLPREISMCSHVVGNNKMLTVDDMEADERFADHPIHTQGKVRFYSGAPLRAECGQPIGSLCIADHKPRKITQREKDLLQMIADGIMTEVKLRGLSQQLGKISRDLSDRNQTLERDLTSARMVQQFLLPPALVQAGIYDVSHLYRPFDHIGGDFLDIHIRADGSASLLIADVSGHGASAALSSAMLKTSFLRASLHAHCPGQILTSINHEMSRFMAGGTFITAIAAHLDSSRKTVQLASAGHPYPLLTHKSEARPIHTDNGLPMLIDPDAKYNDPTTITLDADERLLLFTDGAIEAANPAGEFLGFSGLARELIDAANQNPGNGFLDNLFARIDGWAKSALKDDVALVCINGPQ